MKTVKVSKVDLLNVLKKNREIHEKEFNELWADFQLAIIHELKRLLEESKTSEFKRTPVLDAVQPRSYAKEYDEVIGLLEFSTDTEFDITQDEYREYVLNEWSWSRNFDMMKTSYGKM